MPDALVHQVRPQGHALLSYRTTQSHTETDGFLEGQDNPPVAMHSRVGSHACRNPGELYRAGAAHATHVFTKQSLKEWQYQVPDTTTGATPVGVHKGTLLISTWHDVLRPRGSSAPGQLTVPPLSRGKGTCMRESTALGPGVLAYPKESQSFLFALRRCLCGAAAIISVA